MSSFKRMKLVNDNYSSNYDDLSKILKYDTPTSLHRMSDLDSDMINILNRDIEEETKAKLYSQALRRFLTFKQQHHEDSSVKQIELPAKNLIQKVTIKKKKEKKAIVKKT